MTQSAMTHRANLAYRGSAVSVPPLKGVIMLLNGAITSLQKSLLAQEARRFDEGYEDLTRATAILRGLSYHLDFVRGGALAEQLFTMYNSLILACLRSYGQPQAAQHYRRIIASLSELREAWEFVEGTAARATKTASGESVVRR
jgi:flagellar secretion chaperone FliS